MPYGLDYLDQLRNRLDAATAVFEAREKELQAKRVELARSDAKRERARRREREAAIEAAEGAVAGLEEGYERALGRYREALAGLEEARAGLALAEGEEDALIALLPAHVPIALLPVRVETRFFPLEDATGYELRIRVYPDVTHSDMHEPELTDDEVTWGKDFWTKTRAEGTQDGALQVWTMLCQRFGSRRAAWIARVLEPAEVGGSLVFPSAERRSASWTRASRTTVLPDRFAAIGYVDGKRIGPVWGAPIPDPLNVGPAPGAVGTEVVDEEMKWMVDFDEAERVGMALRVQLVPAEFGLAETKLDRLLVLGVKASLARDRSAERLEALLEAHHYSDGLELVRAGTPSNNSDDAPSGFTAGDDAVSAFEIDRGPPLSQVDDRSDADRLARALGISTAIFEHVRGAASRQEQDAEAINAALWPATWGYFLSEMMAETLTGADYAAARRHFVEFVRARGWVLRVGDQPIGVLPVTSLGLWKPLPLPPPRPLLSAAALHDNDDRAVLARLAGFLQEHLWPIWQASLSDVPRIGRTGDPELDVSESLSATPLSSHYAVRWGIGRELLLHFWSFFGWSSDPWDAFWNAFDGQFTWSDVYAFWYGQAQLLAELQGRGLDWAPRLTAVLFAGQHTELAGPLVHKAPLSEEEPLPDAVNYIDWLLRTDYRTIQAADENTPVPLPQPLLYLLLRHSLLLAFATAAVLVEERLTAEERASETIEAEELSLPERRLQYEPELVDMDPAAPTTTAWRRLEHTITVEEDVRTIGSILQQLVAQLRPVAAARMAAAEPAPTFLEELQDFIRALAHLRDLSTAALDRLLREELDLCSHRLDAWVTSLAARQLRAVRAAGDGLHLGAFGWLENLRPRAMQPTYVPDPSGATGLVALDPDNAGFVHAPSLGHAATAAVLRSAHLSHAGADGDRFALDLSSRRARTALFLLDGVRQGQSLNALLGYRFERGLHEGYPGLELDRYISPFRRLAPLVAGKRETDAEAKQAAVETLAESNVVDGRLLLERWRTNQIPWGQDGLPPATGSRRNAVVAELEALADAEDATADAVMAEAVYQVVQGNQLRAGAALDAVSDGEAPPPELQVLRSARSGVGATQRLLVLFSDAAAPAVVQGLRKAREDSEPRLNAWAKALFGNQPVRCRVTFEPFVDAGGAVHAPPPEEVLLSALQLSPLDVLYLAEPSEEERRSELDQRIVYYALRARNDVPADVVAHVVGAGNFVRQGELALDELLELARAARELATGTPRPVEARDLALPTEAAKAVEHAIADLNDLSGRVNRAKNRLQTAREALEEPLPTNPQTLRARLVDAAYLGVDGAVPLVAKGSDAQKYLARQAASVREELAAREREIKKLEDAFAALVQPTTEERRDHHVARLEAAFGGGFRVLPRFKLAAEQRTEIAKAFAGATAQGATADAVAQWLVRVGPVRLAVDPLQTVLLYARALGRPVARLQVAQLPFDAADRWNALATSPFPGGRIAIVANVPGPVSWTDNLCGLFVDEWTDVVPSDIETTGVTFHFDAPNSEPPQAILLAVTPDERERWDLALLERIVNEALDLAKVRTVDADSLRDLGHFLPALLFANNYAGDTVATDFSRNLARTD